MGACTKSCVGYTRELGGHGTLPRPLQEDSLGDVFESHTPMVVIRNVPATLFI